MFSKFKLFRKVEPAGTAQDLLPESDPTVVDLDDTTSEPLAEIKKQPSAEAIKRLGDDIKTAQRFFSDRAQFGIGMACNAAQDQVQLRSFVDFNLYDVKCENQSFWKLQTQTGLMFGQMNKDGASVYPGEINKNEPFEDSKLGRGLASFGGQFQPEMAQSKPLLEPVMSVASVQIDKALAFCTSRKAAIAIALLIQQLPEAMHCDLVTMRRLQKRDNGKQRVSLGLRLRNSAGVTKPFRLLLDDEKAVLVDQSSKVVASTNSEAIEAASVECQIDQ